MLSIAQPSFSSKTEPFLSGFSSYTPIDSLMDESVDQGEALDLYKGHLPLTSYVPVTRNLGHDPLNWFMPVDGFDPSKQYHQVLKIQPLASGGYEATVTTQDLGKIASVMDGHRRGVVSDLMSVEESADYYLDCQGGEDFVQGEHGAFQSGKREKGQRKENDVISSQRRAKTNVRLRIKSMGLEALLTLSIRENDPDTYRSIEEWGVLWDKYVRMCKRNGIEFEYVAVLETHKKGNYHLHAAITGPINLKKARRFWYVCLGGRGDEKGSLTPGNIDVSYKFHLTRHKRRQGVAKYVSKYIAKQSGHVEFNKKRYWSSKHKLPTPRRYILKSMDILDVMEEISLHLGLVFNKVFDAAYQFSKIKDGVVFHGLWLEFDDALLEPVPF